MKVLFDVNTPHPLRRHLPEHEVTFAQDMGWAELRNGELIKAAEGRFDVLLTADQNLRYQQNLLRARARHPCDYHQPPARSAALCGGHPERLGHHQAG